MNAISPALAAQLAATYPTATPVDAFINRVTDGYISPEQMVDVIHAMHAALVDRFPNIALWMAVDLEQTADTLTKAIECAERNEQDFPALEAA